MQTIIFLNQGSFENYDPDVLFADKQCRYVLLYDNAYTTTHPEHILSRFDKVYRLEKVLVENKDSIDEHKLKHFYHAIKQEIERVGKNNLALVRTGELNILLSGVLCDHFNLPGASYEHLQRYRHKLIMKQRLVEHNIRVPKFCHFSITAAEKDIKSSYQTLISDLGPVFIIKPTQGASAIATMKIKSLGDFKQYIEMHRASEEDHEAEEFIDGKLYHIDGLVKGGRVVFSVCSEYLYPNLTFFSAHKIMATMPLSKKLAVSKKLTQFNGMVLGALGPVDGATHMEVFVTQAGELVFLEVAARVPGGPVNANYQQQYGFNLANLHILAQLGQPISISATDLEPKTYVFSGLIPCLKGRVTKLYQFPFKSRYKVDWKIEVGDIIDYNSRSFFDYAAVFYVENKNADMLREDFEKLRSFIPYKVVPL